MADTLAPSTTWVVPLAAAGESLGTLLLTRTLLKQPPFESPYFVTALAEGFSRRLWQLLGTPLIALRQKADVLTTPTAHDA
jgi:hypothetical protein